MPLWSFEGAPALLDARSRERPRREPRDLDNLGGHSGGGTPLPIPNREVKPASADGTRGASPRESRTPPAFHPADRDPRARISIAEISEGGRLRGSMPCTHIRAVVPKLAAWTCETVIWFSASGPRTTFRRSWPP